MSEEKKAFIEQLTKDGETALREAIGGRLGEIYSPSIWIRRHLPTMQDDMHPHTTFSVATVSIPIDSQKYLVIKNAWAETPIELLDYYFLSAAISGVPDGIKVETNPEFPQFGPIIQHPFSSLNFSTKAKYIRRITVYEFLEEGEKDEKVQYDTAIVFEREDDSVVCFRVEQSPATTGDLEILTHYPDIEKYLNNPDLEEYQTFRLRLDFS